MERKRKSILVAGYVWHGGLTECCARAFQRLGYKVQILYLNKINPEDILNKVYETALGRLVKPLTKTPGTRSLPEKLVHRYGPKFQEEAIKDLNERFIEAVIGFEPDLVFMPCSIDFLLKWESIQAIKEKLSVPVFTWFGDNPLLTLDNSLLLKYLDHIFVPDPAWIPAIRLVTNQPVHHLPEAADPETYKPVDLSEEEQSIYSCDIGFVGNGYIDGTGVMRAGILNELIAHWKVKIFGGPRSWGNLFKYFPSLRSSFGGRLLPVKETNKLFNASKIVLNIHHVQNIQATSTRTFEIALSGSFQLADKKADLANLFVIDKEIICYESLEELHSLVAYYLEHEEKRREIAERARQRALNEHTFVHRMEKVLEYL